MLSREEGFKFQRVRWAKRSVPTRESACRERRVGAARSRAFAHPTLLLRMANRGWKPKAWLRVLSSRGNERRVRCVMKDELTTILDAMRAAQAELADYLVSADR